MELPELLTTVQVAEMTGLRRNTITYHIQRGNLHAIETVRGFRFDPLEVARFMDEARRVGWPRGRKRKQEPAQHILNTKKKAVH